MGRITIRCGGQSGVDRAALSTAAALGLPYVGWCPKGGWAEDYKDPPGLMREFPNLRETPSSEPEQRTAWNVRDSDATLIVSPHANFAASPGMCFARLCAELIFVKPWQIADLEREPLEPFATSWLLGQLEACGTTAFCLNIAGPRESEAPGIQDIAQMFLVRLLRAVL